MDSPDKLILARQQKDDMPIISTESFKIIIASVISIRWSLPSLAPPELIKTSCKGECMKVD